MTNEQACEQLAFAAARKFCPSLASTFPPPFCLAMLLAHERAKGKSSKWYHYINTLPEDIPCAWALSNEAATRAVEDLDCATASRLLDARTVATAGVQEFSRRVKQLYGPPFGATGLDDEGALLWAAGMVVSRSYAANESVLAMAPLVDLCNHSYEARKPYFDEWNGLPVTAVAAPEHLGAGDELCVSYRAAEICDELSWLNFGYLA
eukprot:gene32329-40968_t